MQTTLFLSTSIDGMIADENGIPLFPEGAWQDWCALVNQADNVIAGRSSYEQLQNDEMAAKLHPTHKIVLSTGDLDLGDTSWRHAKTPAEALSMLAKEGVTEAIVGGGRAVAHSFMRENLIDSIVIDLQPVAFGIGVPVFGDALEIPRLKLISSKKLNEDALRLRYQVLK